MINAVTIKYDHDALEFTFSLIVADRFTSVASIVTPCVYNIAISIHIQISWFTRRHRCKVLKYVMLTYRYAEPNTADSIMRFTFYSTLLYEVDLHLTSQESGQYLVMHSMIVLLYYRLSI